MQEKIIIPKNAGNILKKQMAYNWTLVRHILQACSFKKYI
jgi:hypothetical protein